MISYCPKCGKPNQYSDVKPNFCGFCQGSLGVNTIDLNVSGSSRAVRPTPATARRRRPAPEPEYDDEEELEEEEEYYDPSPIQGRSRRSIMSSSGFNKKNFELKPQARESMNGERLDMAAVFSNGAVAARHTNGLTAARPPKETYNGGDQKAYLRNLLLNRLQSSKDKPIEIGEHTR